ncbi:hypothetical protein ACVWY3_007739 [Bradyrhizobium sp. USDA 4486]
MPPRRLSRPFSNFGGGWRRRDPQSLNSAWQRPQADLGWARNLRYGRHRAARRHRDRLPEADTAAVVRLPPATNSLYCSAQQSKLRRVIALFRRHSEVLMGFDVREPGHNGACHCVSRGADVPVSELPLFRKHHPSDGNGAELSVPRPGPDGEPLLPFFRPQDPLDREAGQRKSRLGLFRWTMSNKIAIFLKRREAAICGASSKSDDNALRFSAGSSLHF